MIENSKVMVTGSDGFIGSNLVAELKRRKAQVVCVDKESGFDITDRPTLYGDMEGVKYLFHMAVLPYGPCALFPRECVNVNIIGTLNVIQAACDAKVKKVIYSSASAVYGDSDLIVDERHPLNAGSLYGASKLMGELMVRNVCEKNGVDYVILRYMNVYGPGQKNGLIPVMLNGINEGQHPTIYGDGSQSCVFVVVYHVFQSNKLGAVSRVTGGALNNGGVDERTIKAVVDMMLDMAHSDLKPIYKPVEGLQVRRRVGSIQKAMDMLGYSPKVEFNEGIRELIYGQGEGHL